MQNVLCRLRWLTSPPNSPGLARPSNAFRFAPSTYTWPPLSWTIRQTSVTLSSYTPCVDGYVIMMAASRSACSEALARRSSRSTVPSLLPLTTTTFMPAITAEAALVPWALAGIRQMFRPSSPCARWYDRIASRPASSPWLPALGWIDTFA
jgi:hypothetical protein